MTQRFRFGRDRRLLHRWEFVRVFDRGVRERSRGFTVIALRAEATGSRLGISVGKRYGNAVRRNRIKRHFREAFRLEPDRIPPGVDFVVIPYPELHGEPFSELRHRFLRAIERATRRLES